MVGNCFRFRGHYCHFTAHSPWIRTLCRCWLKTYTDIFVLMPLTFCANFSAKLFGHFLHFIPWAWTSSSPLSYLPFCRFTCVAVCLFQVREFLNKLEELMGKVTYEGDPVKALKPDLQKRADTLLTELLKRSLSNTSLLILSCSLSPFPC